VKKQPRSGATAKKKKKKKRPRRKKKSIRANPQKLKFSENFILSEPKDKNSGYLFLPDGARSSALRAT
jgi:hypothetical protein